MSVKQDGLSSPLPHQEPSVVAATTAKTVPFNIIGHVTVTNDTPKPRPHNVRDSARTMYLLIDGGANISVLMSTYQSWLTNLRLAKTGDVVMMNAHPAPIKAYGDLRVDVHDDATGEWRQLVLLGVAVVPSSDFNLLGWTSYADQLAGETSDSNVALQYQRQRAIMPLAGGGTVTAARRHGLFSLRARKMTIQDKSARRNWRALTAHENTDDTDTAVPLFQGKHHDLPEISTDREAPDQSTEKEIKDPETDHEAPEQVIKRSPEDLEDDLKEKWGRVVIAKARELIHLFHCTIGHCASVGAIQSMVRAGQLVVHGEAAVRKYIMQMNANELECLSCRKAATNKNHPKDSKTAQTPGMWIMDVSGKYWKSKRAFKYVLVVVAPNGKGIFCSFLRRRSQVLMALKRNRKFWERTTGEKMLTLRMDRAGEHTKTGLVDYLVKKGIEPSFIATGASAGASEAYIHLLQDAMSANLNGYAEMHNTNRPVHLWPEAMAYASFCRECAPSTTNDGVSMYEHRTGRPPPFHKMLPWGTTVTAAIPRALRTKGEDKGRVARFVGFPQHGDGYKMYDHTTNTFFTSNSIRPFVVSAGLGIPVEKTTLSGAPENNYYGALDGTRVDPEHTPVNEEEQGNDHDQGNEDMEEQGDVRDMEEQGNDVDDVNRARSSRNRRQTQQTNIGHDEWQTYATDAKCQRLAAEAGGNDNTIWNERDSLVATLTQRGNKLGGKIKSVRNFLKARRGGIAATLPEGEVPDTEAQALSGPDAEWWRAAIDEETNNMTRNKVMEAVSEEEKCSLPRKPIKSRFVFDLKLRAPSCTMTGPTYRTFADGRKVRYKCRMVAKGFSQREGVDFDPDQTYAPTPQMESIRLILARTLGLGWNLRQLDVTAAFLIASLPEEEQMLMDLPNGRGLVRLLKSLYGLRQSAHHWSREINATLMEHGFQCVDADRGVYVMYDNDGQLKCCMALHVDDLLISAPDDILDDVVKGLKERYDMREENADWFLKIRITRATDRRSLALSQPDYAASIVKMAGLDPETSKPARTPMELPLFKGTDIPFTEEEEAVMANVYETYGTVVGMLGHLSNATRPDLSYSVNQCRAYTSNPRLHHWEALKRIVRYLKGTMNYGLVYSTVHGKDLLQAFCDADWATDVDDRKSVTGNTFIYMGAAIGWKSVKQTAVARSTAEAELAALDITARDALWYRKMAEALRLSTSKTITIFEDNAAASAIANGSKWSAKTKHVATRYFAVRDDVLEKRIEVLPVDTADNIADFFTKPLTRVNFEKFRDMMGVCDVSCIV